MERNTPSKLDLTPSKRHLAIIGAFAALTPSMPGEAQDQEVELPGNRIVLIDKSRITYPDIAEVPDGDVAKALQEVRDVVLCVIQMNETNAPSNFGGEIPPSGDHDGFFREVVVIGPDSGGDKGMRYQIAVALSSDDDPRANSFRVSSAPARSPYPTIIKDGPIDGVAEECKIFSQDGFADEAGVRCQVAYKRVLQELRTICSATVLKQNRQRGRR